MVTSLVNNPAGWAILGDMAASYDQEGGGGQQFRDRMLHSPHTFRHYRLTAAWEALQVERKFYPWRHKR